MPSSLFQLDLFLLEFWGQLQHHHRLHQSLHHLRFRAPPPLLLLLLLLLLLPLRRRYRYQEYESMGQPSSRLVLFPLPFLRVYHLSL